MAGQYASLTVQSCRWILQAQSLIVHRIDIEAIAMEEAIALTACRPRCRLPKFHSLLLPHLVHDSFLHVVAATKPVLWQQHDLLLSDN